MGVFDSQRLSIVPELALTLGWDFTPQMRGTIGYDLLYWTGVARPGDQIDLNLDPRQFPPPTGFHGHAPAVRAAHERLLGTGLELGA